jgi:hypothetical protein
MVEQIGDLINAIVGIDQDDAATKRIQCKEVEQELGPLVEQDRHAMTQSIARRSITGADRRHIGCGISPVDLETIGIIVAALHRENGIGGLISSARKPFPRRLRKACAPRRGRCRVQCS